MTEPFGAAFLVTPELFPARISGEPWGDQTLGLDLGGTTHRFVGLGRNQLELMIANHGAEPSPAPEPEAIETQVFEVSERDFRPIDLRGWDYTLDVAVDSEAIRVAGLDFMAKLELRPTLRGALFTSAGQGVRFQRALEGYLRFLVAYSVLLEKGVLVHSAGIEHDGAGYLFYGHSSAGKTTVARTSLQRGCSVLSDDMNVIRLGPEGPELRSVPLAGTLGVHRPGRVPLRGLFRLVKSDTLGLRPLSGARALAALLGCTPFVSDDPHRSEALSDRLVQFVQACPSWELSLRKGEDFWDTLLSEMEKVRD